MTEQNEPEQTEQTAPSKPHTTMVKPGDTIHAVAARLGVTVEHLKKVNGLRHDLLSHGVRLHD